MNPSKESIEYIKNYINLKTDIVLLIVSKKMSDAASIFVFAIIMGFVLLFVSLFLSLSLSSWLANELNMPGIGNLIVSLIYTIIAIILFKYREKLILSPVKELMSRSMDFSDLHNESSIEKDETIENSIEHAQTKLKDVEADIDQNIVDIKLYYSFDELKNRFVESIYSDPKSILSILMILREVIRNRSKEKHNNKL